MEKTYNGYTLAKRLVYYGLGVLESLLAFRFIFRLLGANPQSVFVAFIYALTRIFLAPFINIFKPFVTEGIETRAVFEPATLIAMIVYGLIAYGIVRLIDIRIAHSPLK